MYSVRYNYNVLRTPRRRPHDLQALAPNIPRIPDAADRTSHAFGSGRVPAALLPRLAVDGGLARLPGRRPNRLDVGGHVDAVDAALVGGALTAAGLGAAQWWAAKGALGRPAAWIGASALGYAVGLAAGAALVGYETDLGALALMGLVSGAALGAAQGLVLARQGRRALALPWALAMPVLFALGWSLASVTGIGVDDQFTVFGAGGALLFTLLSGLLVARFTPARAQVA